MTGLGHVHYSLHQLEHRVMSFVKKGFSVIGLFPSICNFFKIMPEQNTDPFEEITITLTDGFKVAWSSEEIS
jgi:hypothetical protein